MEEFAFVVEIDIKEDYEYKVKARTKEKAIESLKKFLEDKSKIDPWKAKNTRIMTKKIIKVDDKQEEICLQD